MLKTQEYTSLQPIQSIVVQTEEMCVEAPAKSTNSARVCIQGDLRFCVNEQEAAQGPVIGHYALDVQGMQKPLFVLWHAEGKVSSPQWPSTDIAFDLRDAKVGQVCTYVVQAQVTEQNGEHCVISSVFVQIFVIGQSV